MLPDSPALLIDNQKMLSNIASMQNIAIQNNINLRPHTKTHKSPDLAKLQLKYGAKGITVAKLGEAEIMADSGIDDILIANIIIGEAKLKRLISLKGRLKNLITCTDSIEAAMELNTAYLKAGLKGKVHIEINSGLNRCGLSNLNDIINLAFSINKMENLELTGILTHGGHAYNALDISEIRQIGIRESEFMLEIVESLAQNGIFLKEVSVGSSPTSKFCSTVKGITEIRPGNYIFSDMTQVSLGTAKIDECALTLLATVISTPEKGRAIIDAGHKALGLDKCPIHSQFSKSYGYIIGKSANIVRLSEEHGVIEFSDESFTIGEKIRIIPNHACAVVNLHDEFCLIENDEIIGNIPISARGKMR